MRSKKGRFVDFWGEGKSKESRSPPPAKWRSGTANPMERARGAGAQGSIVVPALSLVCQEALTLQMKPALHPESGRRATRYAVLVDNHPKFVWGSSGQFHLPA